MHQTRICNFVSPSRTRRDENNYLHAQNATVTAPRQRGRASSASHLVALWALVSLLVGCSTESGDPELGHYVARLTLPGGPAPFGLEIAKQNAQYVLYLTNGVERTEVRNVQVKDGEIRARFPGYENHLRARIEPSGLDGEVTLIKAGSKEQVIPFEAKLGTAPRFFDGVSENGAMVQGRWALVFTDESGKTTPAVALLEQQGDRVTGTVMTPTGDHRYLEGQLNGKEIKLSTFAGGLVYLYHLRLVGEATLQGEYWQGLAWHENVSGQRNDQATLAEATISTTLRSPDERLTFSFPDVDGRAVSLDDPRFRGKVVLVTIGGTWCPNCHDEAQFLVPFYRQYQAKGFEVVGLMFERHGAFDKAAAAVRSYQRDFEVDFPLLIAGVSDNDDASKKLPALSGVYGYPTAILIDKRGKIRNIHTGFSGPATGKFYEEYVAEFTAKVDELLAE